MISIILIILIFSIIITNLIILGREWVLFSKFFHSHYSYFDFVFITLYFLEQFAFLLAYNLIKEYRELWIALIVLFVLTTASMERFAMEKKNKKITGDVSNSFIEQKRLADMVENQNKENKILKDKNKSLIDFIERGFQAKSRS